MIYVLIVLGGLVALTRRWSTRGKLFWHTLHWSHITHDARGVGPRRLGILRLAMSAWTFTTLIAMALDKPECLATFTIWCWTLIALYLGVAGVASLLESVKGSSEPDVTAETSRRKKVLGCIMWIWFEAVFCTAILVFLMVWLVLLPTAYLANGTDLGLLSFLPLNAHNLNVVFMGTEMLFNRLAFVPSHVIFAMFYGLVYVVFSWFYFLFDSHHRFWYFFLDWRLRATPIWYTILIAIIWAAFALGQKLVSRAKAHVATELPGSAREAWPAAAEAAPALPA